MKDTPFAIEREEKMTNRQRLQNLLDWLVATRLGAVDLKHHEARCASLNDYICLAYNWRFHGITLGLQQVSQEIERLLALLYQHEPKHTLEIGTGLGGTLYLFSKVASSDGTLVTVNLPRRLPRTHFIESLARHHQKVLQVLGNSHNEETFNQVKGVIPLVDFLYIDGDHSYEGVRKDFEMYSGLVQRGGLIAFHDICQYPSIPSYGVDRFWLEIRQKYPHEEIVRDWKQGWGIGLIHV